MVQLGDMGPLTCSLFQRLTFYPVQCGMARATIPVRYCEKTQAFHVSQVLAECHTCAAHTHPPPLNLIVFRVMVVCPGPRLRRV